MSNRPIGPILREYPLGTIPHDVKCFDAEWTRWAWVRHDVPWPAMNQSNRRRLYVFLGTLAVALAASLGYTWLRPAEYRASARLEITPACRGPPLGTCCNVQPCVAKAFSYRNAGADQPPGPGTGCDAARSCRAALSQRRSRSGFRHANRTWRRCRFQTRTSSS